MGKYFDPNICISSIFYTFFAFDLETFISKIWKKYIVLPEMCTFGQNTFPYCSRIIAVHVFVSVFLLSSPNVSRYCERNKTRK